MADMNKLNPDELEVISGGRIVAVNNTAANYANIRVAPGLDSKIAFKAYNGFKLNTTGKTVKKDNYVWYEVVLTDGTDHGWVVGSLIGL